MYKFVYFPAVPNKTEHKHSYYPSPYYLFCSKPPSLSMQFIREIYYPFQVRYARLSRSLALAYIDEGTGPHTLVFVHGLGSNLKAWLANIPTLSQHYRCIAIDLPGYGKSSTVAHSGKMGYFSRVLQQFLELMELEQVTLVGHSMGGMVCLHHSLSHPDRSKRLILAAPAGFEAFSPLEVELVKRTTRPELFLWATPAQVRQNIERNFYQFSQKAEFLVQDRLAMREAADFKNYCEMIPRCIAGMLDEPVYSRLSEIQKPCLLIFGAEDQLIPNRFLHKKTTCQIAQKGAGRLPRAELHCIEKAGHFVQFEKASFFNKRVRSFMDTIIL